MHCQSSSLVYFSATGTTQKIMKAMSDAFTGPVQEYDLLQHPIKQKTDVNAESLLMVGMPVYSGRIPAHCLANLENLKGQNTPAVAVVVYGNRAYDDALLELKNFVESHGFFLIGAAAFVARHSIFPHVATERPDENDLKLAADFARRCGQKLAALASPSAAPTLPIPGNFPYREIKPGGIRPTVDLAECILCGACVDICPVNALTIDTTVVRDNERCVSCGACIHVCPTGAQGYRGPQYEAMHEKFIQTFSAPREPEIIL